VFVFRINCQDTYSVSHITQIFALPGLTHPFFVKGDKLVSFNYFNYYIPKHGFPQFTSFAPAKRQTNDHHCVSQSSKAMGTS
jgi:hypothetical protein